MKKALFSLLFLLALLVQAQFRINNDKVDKNIWFDEKPFSYGYYLGYNYFTFDIHPNRATGGINSEGKFNVTAETSGGFTAGLIGKMRLNNHFDLLLQPGVSFTERTFHFSNIKPGQTVVKPDGEVYTFTEEDQTRKVKASYVDVPLFLQLHGNRWHNTRPYIQAGVGYALNLESEEKSEQDNEDGIFRMKTHNFTWQVEAGVSIYFNRFKLTPSIKGVFFYNNELVADDPATPKVWAGALKSISSRALVFSLKFE